MEVDANVCLRCGACASVCPFDAVEVVDKHVSTDERCTDCGICMKACPVGAIMIERRV